MEKEQENFERVDMVLNKVAGPRWTVFCPKCEKQITDSRNNWEDYGCCEWFVPEPSWPTAFRKEKVQELTPAKALEVMWSDLDKVTVEMIETAIIGLPMVHKVCEVSYRKKRDDYLVEFISKDRSLFRQTGTPKDIATAFRIYTSKIVDDFNLRGYIGAVIDRAIGKDE